MFLALLSQKYYAPGNREEGLDGNTNRLVLFMVANNYDAI
jgi:hypothetical protein